MPEHSERTGELIKRIAEAPRATREELLKAVLGEDEVKSQTVLNGLLHGTAPPAAEWIDLADAGPYVDETKMPLFSPNGDGSGGVESFDNDDTRTWMQQALDKIARGASPDDEAASDTAAATNEPHRRNDRSD